MSAAGGLSAATASGVINYIYGRYDGIADIIPVDYVSNAIIVSTAMCADKPGLTVVHSNSSHLNPISWGKYTSIGYTYLETQPLSTQVFKIDPSYISNKPIVKTLFFLRS